MCGASSGLKAAASAARTLASDAASEAQTIFGASSTVFNNLIGGIQRIVTGGPSQQGMSAGEFNASQAAITQNTAALARNLRGAAGSAAAAIGGGNTVTPAGGTQAAILAAETAAAEQGASAQNQLVQQNYDIGRNNFWRATQTEESLPNVFNPATSATSVATGAQAESLKAQQAVDTSNNWWQPMVTAAIGGISSGIGASLTGGIGKAASAAKGTDSFGSSLDSSWLDVPANNFNPAPQAS
jgi:hypothetical protein